MAFTAGKAYSDWRAMAGSIRVARRAGTMVATMQTITSAPAARPSARGSRGLTP